MSDAAAPRTGLMRTKRRIDAAIASIVFAVAVTLAIIVLTAMLVVQGYRGQFQRAEAAAASNAHIVAVHTQWLVEASLQSLERIRDNLARGNDLPGAQSIGDLNQQVSGLPDYVRISVYGPRGILRLTNAQNAQSLSISEQHFFSEIAAGQEIAFAPLVDGDDAAMAGFTVARRLDAGEGLVGIATATIPNAMLAQVWQSLDLERDSTISLVREDGVLLARYPALDQPASLAEDALITQHLSEAPSGTYTQRSPVDGVDRAVGYRSLDGLPIVAVTAISTGAVISSFWSDVSIAIVIIGFALIGLLAALVWLLRILHRDRRTREQLAAALEQNQVLFREIHHRVKNNLQAVSSLVQLQPVPPEVKSEMGRRIAAMVAVHEHIYRTDQFESAEISAYLKKLVCDIAQGFDTKASIETEITNLRVHRDHLMPLGLIVNEAVCNAIKYAFPDGRDGTIRVEVVAEGERRARLRVSDDGIGFDASVASDGMGRRLVQGLAQQLGGQLIYQSCPEGTVLMLSFVTEPEAQEDDETF